MTYSALKKVDLQTVKDLALKWFAGHGFSLRQFYDDVEASSQLSETGKSDLDDWLMKKKNEFLDSVKPTTLSREAVKKVIEDYYKSFLWSPPNDLLDKIIALPVDEPSREELDRVINKYPWTTNQVMGGDFWQTRLAEMKEEIMSWATSKRRGKAWCKEITWETQAERWCFHYEGDTSNANSWTLCPICGAKRPHNPGCHRNQCNGIQNLGDSGHAPCQCTCGLDTALRGLGG